MKKEKMINGIQAFNDFYYKDCFYNALFPIVLHFGRNIMNFFYNDISFYTCREQKDWTSFQADYLSENPLESVIESIGVHVNKLGRVSDVVKKLQESLDNDYPVILSIDCFYMSIRRDTFMKEHHPHHILIYGYSEERNHFLVMEHKHKDSLSYDKTEVSFSDISNSYQGYLVNFCGQEKFSYLEFSEGRFKEGTESINMYREQFKSNLFKHNEIIIQGLESLAEYTNIFKKELEEGMQFPAYINNLLKSVNTTVNVKKVETYRIKNLLPENLIIRSYCEKILSSWLFVRNVLVRSMYICDIKTDYFEKCTEKLDEIHHLELQYMNLLLKYH
ncbi:BtrH N-terminal domain-containing protein [Paenibacillus tengchongensis]|uniref:BtrH N-terminal domain-containing protein n=1 Tax=Paenibacillus tengchongensis TaxID=2608684 RepID=UPI00124E64A9|nr:BtrH N-terminal domain-containing protein [Paenibacillus tengchongensis]